jgi:proteasome lid subunit RPN8/RPN11
LGVLRISKSDLDGLYGHAERCLPLESAALLFGRLEGSNIVVTRTELVDNVLSSRVAFEVDPVTEYQLLQDAEVRGEDMVGIFHSHPAPPQPSESDLHNMNLNPVVWLIASRTTGRWKSRAFLLEGKRAIEVSLVVA